MTDAFPRKIAILLDRAELQELVTATELLIAKGGQTPSPRAKGLLTFFARQLAEHPFPQPALMRLTCPKCGNYHVDAGEWAKKFHKTHLCEHCGTEWAPYPFHTFGGAG